MKTMTKKKRPLVPNGGNDDIQTPYDLAHRLVDHFQPSGRCLEPCRGDGAFYSAMNHMAGVNSVQWFEIKECRDFLKNPSHTMYDWIITNPPWSKITAFLEQSVRIADNIVFLCLINAIFQKARQRILRESHFGIVEILEVPTPKEWPSCGFSLAAIWMRRGWFGPIHNHRLLLAETDDDKTHFYCR